jgi:hypothetical protein
MPPDLPPHPITEFLGVILLLCAYLMAIDTAHNISLPHADTSSLCKDFQYLILFMALVAGFAGAVSHEWVPTYRKYLEDLKC